MFGKIVQIVHYWAPKSGIGNIVTDIKDMLDSHAIENEVYEVINGIDSLRDILTPNSLALIHNPINPGSFIPLLEKVSCPKVLLYHNITPAVTFEGYSPADMKNRDAQHIDIIHAARYFPYAWGDSEYNCIQLREAGYARTVVANPPYNFERYENKQTISTTYKSEITSILFVGTFTPSKRQEDLIRAFYYYHRINPNSELTLVGSYWKDTLTNKLHNLAKTLMLPVNFANNISNDDLAVCFQNADLFLSMSEHEGFCIPLIEAMHFGVPIIAFDSSAVPETVGNAGILFKQKHFPFVAHLMDEVLRNKELREKMVASGKERAKYFSKENTSKRFMKLIEDYAAELNL